MEEKTKGLKREVYEIEIIFLNGGYTVIIWRLNTYGVFHKVYKNVSESSIERLEYALNFGVFSGSTVWRTILDTVQNKVRYIHK